MFCTHPEIVWLQIHCMQFVEVFRPQTRKFIQQLRCRLAFNFFQVSATIKALESFGLGKLPYAGHPIHAFAVNQMADNIERTPGAFTFVSGCPRFRQITQKRIESGGSASEKRNCVLQVVFGHSSRWMRSGHQWLDPLAGNVGAVERFDRRAAEQSERAL